MTKGLVNQMLTQKEQIDKMVEKFTEVAHGLADTFNVPRPTIQYSGVRDARGHCHFYRDKKPSKLTFGYRLWHDVTDAAIHEVAHAIAWHKYTEYGHGARFKQVLQQCVILYYGDINAYNWQYEYPSVAVAAGVRPATNNDKLRWQLVNSFMKLGHSREAAEKLIDA